MSHFTKLKTQIVDRDYLLQALDDLELQYEVGELTLSGYQGQEPVEIRVNTENKYDIGFRQTEGVYECVADWWGTGANQKQFMNQVQQRYAYHVTRAKLEAQGFSLVEEQQEGQQVHLYLRRMV